MGMMDSINAINNALRTLLATVLVGAAGVGGYFGYNKYFANELEAERAKTELAEAQSKLDIAHDKLKQQQVEIHQLNDDLQEKEKQIQQLATANRLLKLDHRKAHLSVLDQIKDPNTNAITTRLEFVEVDDNGQDLDAPRQFEIQGDLVYVDGLVVKFDDKYIEAGDLLRGTSICLLRRVFGENQKPLDGYSLMNEGRPPRSYTRGGEVSELDQRIWQDFWEIANDRAKAEELGIRAAHGEAPSMKVQKGKSYRIEMRASGGLSIVPDDTIRPRTVSPKPEV